MVIHHLLEINKLHAHVESTCHIVIQLQTLTLTQPELTLTLITTLTLNLTILLMETYPLDTDDAMGLQTL